MKFGLKFRNSSEFSVVFLIAECNRPSLKAVEKLPLCSNELTLMPVIMGSRSSRQAFNFRVGTGSNGHDFEGESLIITHMVFVDTTLRSPQKPEQAGLNVTGVLGATVDARFCFDIL